jgi:hypothetical protein
MRFNWLFLVVFVTCSVFGQQPLKLQSATLYLTLSNTEKGFPFELLNQHLSLHPDEQLLLAYTRNSPGGVHYTYQQWYKDKPVYLAGVKLHYLPNNKVILQDYRAKINTNRNNPLELWWSSENGIVPASKQVSFVGHKQLETIRDENGAILSSRDLLRYLDKDTTAYTRVFKINPINSANEVYGGDFVDNNDADNASLTAETKWVALPVHWRNDTFFLESEYMFFEDFASPRDTMTYYELTDSFAYTRSEQKFEVVNTYYHINRFAKYVDKLGYSSTIEKVKIDVHGFGGADNSAYDPNDHSLQFGEGGVDDAEDGEVVVHEYVHSLSEMASANTTIGSQREAMEEGICDYMAKAYSRTFNDHTPNEIFSWDGHNEFWSGIDINTNRIYPNDLRNFKDGDRDMWSSALMCVHDIIGREATDSLVLEHLFYQKPNATMPEMSLAMLSVDTALFAGRYSSVLRQCFSKAGFIPTNSVIPKLPNSLEVLNSSGFLLGEGPLVVKGLKQTNWKLYNANGQLVNEGFNDDTLNLYPNDFVKGVYLLHLTTNGESQIIKLIR